jgi:hypothetical protein
MEAIDGAKLNRIVEFVRACGCWFDPGDAAEDLWAVLGEYGIVEELTPEEASEVVLELEGLAEEQQAGEMALQVSLGEEPSRRCRERLRYMD